MRLPRTTTRRWMVAVAIVAFALVTFVFLRRSAHFMRLAAFHNDMARAIRSSPGSGADPKRADRLEELARKYERAAARPWLSVEPDPPRPR